ncbi:LOW QUALITY PROTEIN: zinc carboxypeptidase [Octopus sinensis]|uniref:LOW QUALITY PROTEIN: zinc carboxypeptidase n=1 Tax=Octopus sinensis TaxID=2607531 RepID=A0A6P7TN82_9MOLL|nr:LOW QUALITY PROTEIN: zinc carboxypeptidase [Octopus sinensis]
MKVLIAFLFCLSLAESFNYTNYYLLKVKPQTSDGLDFLKQLETKHPFDYDFWIPPSKLQKNAEVLMPQSAYNSIKDHMKKIGVKVKVLSTNIQSEIDKEKDADRSVATPTTDKFVFIHAIERVIKSYADGFDHASLKAYGNLMKGETFTPSSFLPALERSPLSLKQEYMAAIGSIASTLKVIEHMAKKYKTDQDVQIMVNNFDWVFIPVANPDGYHVTYSQDRLFKKNMKRDPSGTRCVGVDLNRNFNAEWGKEGSISDPCNRAYCGRRAFSEPETVALSKLVRSTRNKLAYFSVHAYSQYLLVPYASKSKKPENYQHLMDVAEKVKQAIYEDSGSRYFVGTPPDVFYPFTGSSFDWAKMVMGIKYAYNLKMGPPSFNGKGFIVPESEIEANYLELYTTLKTFSDHLEK